jgi:hypothetical protein
VKSTSDIVGQNAFQTIPKIIRMDAQHLYVRKIRQPIWNTSLPIVPFDIRIEHIGQFAHLKRYRSRYVVPRYGKVVELRVFFQSVAEWSPSLRRRQHRNFVVTMTVTTREDLIGFLSTCSRQCRILEAQKKTIEARDQSRHCHKAPTFRLCPTSQAHWESCYWKANSTHDIGWSWDRPRQMIQRLAPKAA